MRELLKNTVVSIPAHHKAQLESWLLGHGYLADQHELSADGATAFYAVKELAADEKEDLRGIGAEVLKPGESINDGQ